MWLCDCLLRILPPSGRESRCLSFIWSRLKCPECAHTLSHLPLHVTLFIAEIYPPSFATLSFREIHSCSSRFNLNITSTLNFYLVFRKHVIQPFSRLPQNLAHTFLCQHEAYGFTEGSCTPWFPSEAVSSLRSRKLVLMTQLTHQGQSWQLGQVFQMSCLVLSHICNLTSASAQPYPD